MGQFVLSTRSATMATAQISKKRKFVAGGVFKAELNSFLTRELAEDGYSGVEVRLAPTRTEIIILATRTQNVLGEKGRRIRELTSVVQKDSVSRREPLNCTPRKLLPVVCALLPRLNHCDTNLLAVWLSKGLAMVFSASSWSPEPRAAKLVSGKLRGQRAKSMKFVDGLMIHSGEPTNVYVDSAVRHVLLRQGVLGIRVKIMLPWDPNNKNGPKQPLPDNVSVLEP